MAKTIHIASVEKRYIVRKSGKILYVEVARTRDGKPIVTVFKTLKNVIVRKDEKGRRNEKEDWEHEFKDAEEVDYKQLPLDVRRILSRLLS